MTPTLSKGTLIFKCYPCLDGTDQTIYSIEGVLHRAYISPNGELIFASLVKKDGNWYDSPKKQIYKYSKPVLHIIGFSWNTSIGKIMSINAGTSMNITKTDENFNSHYEQSGVNDKKDYFAGMTLGYHYSYENFKNGKEPLIQKYNDKYGKLSRLYQSNEFKSPQELEIAVANWYAKETLSGNVVPPPITTSNDTHTEKEYQELLKLYTDSNSKVEAIKKIIC